MYINTKIKIMKKFKIFTIKNDETINDLWHSLAPNDKGWVNCVVSGAVYYSNTRKRYSKNNLITEVLDRTMYSRLTLDTYQLYKSKLRNQTKFELAITLAILRNSNYNPSSNFVWGAFGSVVEFKPYKKTTQYKSVFK